MKIKQKLVDTASKSKIVERAINDLRYRIILAATCSLIVNLVYGAYHGILGVAAQSWWFTALFGYYTVLGMTRFAAVLVERKNGSEPSIKTEYFLLGICGVLLLLLSCILAAINYMSLAENNATRYGEITMITIATYTFCKIAMAIVRLIKHRNNPSPLLAAIRRIGYAEVAVSVLTMQRSMLVSFGEMRQSSIRLMNALSGTAVYLFIFILGIIMIKESRGEKMAKSKIVKATEKVGEKVVGAYEKVEETVVGGYKKIENAVVGGYTKIEDAFVDRYLTKEGETVEQAKQRLKNDTSK